MRNVRQSQSDGVAVSAVKSECESVTQSRTDGDVVQNANAAVLRWCCVCVQECSVSYIHFDFDRACRKSRVRRQAS